MSVEHVFMYDQSCLNESLPPPPSAKDESFDRWRADELVRLPHLNENESNPDWSRVEQQLNQSHQTIQDWIDAIRSYAHPPVKEFENLETLFGHLLSEKEVTRHLQRTLPSMARLALRLPELFPHSLPKLRQNTNRCLHLSQQQVVCLLANAFFCTLPDQEESSTDDRLLPNINFNTCVGGCPRCCLKLIKNEFLKLVFFPFKDCIDFHSNEINASPRNCDVFSTILIEFARTFRRVRSPITDEACPKINGPTGLPIWKASHSNASNWFATVALKSESEQRCMWTLHPNVWAEVFWITVVCRKKYDSSSVRNWSCLVCSPNNCWTGKFSSSQAPNNTIDTSDMPKAFIGPATFRTVDREIDFNVDKSAWWPWTHSSVARWTTNLTRRRCIENWTKHFVPLLHRLRRPVRPIRMKDPPFYCWAADIKDWLRPEIGDAERTKETTNTNSPSNCWPQLEQVERWNSSSLASTLWKIVSTDFWTKSDKPIWTENNCTRKWSITINMCRPWKRKHPGIRFSSLCSRKKAILIAQ